MEFIGEIDERGDRVNGRARSLLDTIEQLQVPEAFQGLAFIRPALGELLVGTVETADPLGRTESRPG